MSKCDLTILLDRPDRTYRSGEEVSGTVEVGVNQNVRCDGLILETFWQTHGRGNTDTGPKLSTVLFEGDWLAGTTHRFPFRFTAPDGPPTYHGEYLNVEQYVNVRVDVPWAIDPKLKEDYILLPGSRPYGNLPKAGGHHGGAGALAKAGIPVGVLLIVGGLACLFPFGFLLIPIGLIVLILSLRKVLAEKRLGTVVLDWGSLSVSPGGSVLLRMTITPRKNCRLGGVSATLTATERCTSGSGTNRTTHTHRVHEHAVTLLDECQLTAYRAVEVEGTIPIPEGNAYSFASGDNELVWELEARVDIPLWPDWTEKRVLTVRPAIAAEVVGGPAVARAPTAKPFMDRTARDRPFSAGERPSEASQPDEGAAFAGEPLVPDDASPAATLGPDWEGGPQAETLVPDESLRPGHSPADPSPAADAGRSESALIDVIERLLSVSRFGSEREEIVEQRGDQIFACTIEIDRIDRTFGYVSDDRFRDGRTVTGVVGGTECKVSIQMAAEHNEKLDSSRAGDTFRVHCRLLQWNGIYDRLDMQEV